MERIKEKELKRYVVATIGEDGIALYLKSNHWGNYDLVDNIQYATFLNGNETSQMFYDIACNDFGESMQLVLLPVIITYELVKEI